MMLAQEQESLKQELGALIDSLKLDETRKHFLRARWLESVNWMGRRSNACRNRYYALRLVTILGGVIIPALVSLNISGPEYPFVRWTTFTLSLMVAGSAAVEEFFRDGERWRHYRRTVELLKTEGWQMFQL